MEVRIKSTGYKDEGFPRIIRKISQIKTKQVIFKLDEDSLDGFDLVFDDLKISNLHLIENEEEKSYLTTFTCTEKVFKNILKIIRSIKYLGDCGHSFGIRINGEMFSWDGDGSDRINEINGIDCSRGFKAIDENYRKLLQKDEIEESKKPIKLTETDLNKIVENILFNELFLKK